MRAKVDKFITGKFGAGIDKYCNSIWYIATMCVVCVLCHLFDLTLVGVALLAVLLILALVFCKNAFTTAPFFFMCTFVMSDNNSVESGYFVAWRIALLGVMLAFVVGALAFNLVYYGHWRYIFKRAYLTVSMCVASATLLVGGLFSPSYAAMGALLAVGIGASMFVPYSLMVNCGVYDGEKTVKYIAWALIAASVVVFASVVRKYVELGLGIIHDQKALLEFGYAISNSAAAFVVIALPVTLYLVYKSKYGYLYMIAVLLEVVTVLLTYSRASTVVALPGTIIVTTAMCFKKKTGRIGYWITYGIIMVTCVVLFIVYRKTLIDTITNLFTDDPTGSGRTTLWLRGWNAWKEYPIFGVGMWYLLSYYNYYSFHCTPLTYLFCAGVIGLIAYLYHRYKTVRLVFSAKLTAERVFCALGILAMLINALLDTAMTRPLDLFYYVILLALIERDVKMVSGSDKIITKPLFRGVKHERMQP